MTSRSFALSSLVAAIPGAAVAVLIVLAILNHSGEIFASIPLAATLIAALICGVIVTIAPVVIFFRGRGRSGDARLAPVPRAGEGSGEVFVADGSSDELAAAESSAVLAAAGTSDEILVDDDAFADADEGFADADSGAFVDAGGDEFEEDDGDPFADFDDDADAADGDSFFDQPSKK